MPDESLIEDVAALLGDPAGRIAVAPGHTGGNNRIYVVTAGSRKLVAKRYFRDAADPRDRLQSEYDFLVYTAALGLTTAPQPIARDAERNLGLYEYIEGRVPAPGEMNALIGQAIAFFLDINRADGRDRARALAPASEACMTVSEHLNMVDGRIARLATMPVELEVDRSARAFIGALSGRWETLKSDILGKLRRAGEDPAEPVIERCVSPSDFGFHNSILRSSGVLAFVDFEYAGWDDPAKMAGDFFSHPAMGLERRHFERFLAETMRFSAHAAALAERARTLLPVFQTKWCCIILNDFLSDSARRRRFADPSFDMMERKRIQLEKSRRLFDSIRA